ncbi:GNAT family N-acetyltransferase [Paenibacillus sp. P22]|uniref:GNAT family N-acetyltransferase n=1 Tax=Paenibacillus TaxID=44249 RepID=UPI0004332138|nr:GNAT family N-acetyltransferase [Paenibacillus sp. P22]CDN44820.1 Uncharacterized protein BN871_FQ_00020 [Paenibacillus sp. P22]
MILRIEQVWETDLNKEMTAAIQGLLLQSFPDIYPKDRIFFKQLPHFRFLAYDSENRLIGHAAADYRMMNAGGKPVRVLGVIDLCVEASSRLRGVGSALLAAMDRFCEGRAIDFILLFADDRTLYLKNGYHPVQAKCKWMKVNHETLSTAGIGSEDMDALMVKQVGPDRWNEGELDFLGYLY